MDLIKDGSISLVGKSYKDIPLDIAVEYGPLVKRLDLSHNELGNLEGIEYFVDLEELILDNNNLELPLLPYCPKLHTLTLNKNEIEDLRGLLEILSKQTPNLTYISLLGNKACPNALSQLNNDEEDYILYRYAVINKIHNLKFLDSKPVRLAERKEAEKRASFLDVVKVSKSEGNDDVETEFSKFTPLPKQETKNGKVVMKKKKTTYLGKQSEGNRFIRNTDL